jgi:mitochondrial chaperone BCS1
MDVWVEFKNASKWQCEALFRNFFPSSEDLFAASSSMQGSDASLALDPDMEIPGLTCETLSSSPSSTSVSSSSDKDKEKASTVDPAFPPPPRRARTNAPLDPATLARLAKTFAEAIPDGEFSVAALQGCEFCIASIALEVLSLHAGRLVEEQVPAGSCC